MAIVSAGHAGISSRLLDDFGGSMNGKTRAAAALVSVVCAASPDVPRKEEAVKSKDLPKVKF